MIISPEAITYFLTGKQRIDDKLIIKLAKFRGVEVSDSMRKNLGNFLLCRNKSSETTLKNLKLFLKDIVNNKQFSDKFDNSSLLDEIDLSTPELQLKYMKTIYSDFFMSVNLEDSFLCNEVNNTFKGMFELITLKENGASDVEIEKKLLRSKLLPKIDYNDRLYLEIKNKLAAFNLDLLLYYFACIAVDCDERGAFSLQVMFDYLSDELTNTTNGEFESPFACYISIVKLYYYKKENIKLTDKEIAENYDMDIREYYFYKSGERPLPLKTIVLFMEQGDMLYFMTLFWTKLIAPFAKDDDTRLEIINKIMLYPKLLDIAKVEFNDFER